MTHISGDFSDIVEIKFIVRVVVSSFFAFVLVVVAFFAIVVQPRVEKSIVKAISHTIVEAISHT